MSKSGHFDRSKKPKALQIFVDNKFSPCLYNFEDKFGEKMKLLIGPLFLFAGVLVATTTNAQSILAPAPNGCPKVDTCATMKPQCVGACYVAVVNGCPSEPSCANGEIFKAGEGAMIIQNASPVTQQKIQDLLNSK